MMNFFVVWNFIYFTCVTGCFLLFLLRNQLTVSSLLFWKWFLSFSGCFQDFPSSCLLKCCCDIPTCGYFTNPWWQDQDQSETSCSGPTVEDVLRVWVRQVPSPSPAYWRSLDFFTHSLMPLVILKNSQPLSFNISQKVTLCSMLLLFPSGIPTWILHLLWLLCFFPLFLYFPSFCFSVLHSWYSFSLRSSSQIIF